MAPTTLMAFSKAWRVRMSDGFRSSATISTMRRPDICARVERRASAAGMAALDGRVMPKASTREAIEDAVPMVLQWPAERELAASASRKSASSRVPARTSSDRRHTSVPEPKVRPWNRPDSIGPPETTMAGRSQLAAPMSSAGVVLSQPVSSTTPSMGLPRIDSSTSIEARLRNSMAVGRRLVSPRLITGNSTG